MPWSVWSHTHTFIHAHGGAEVRPEVQDAMRVLLAELYASDTPDFDTPGDPCPYAEDGLVRLHPMPVREGRKTYLDPKLEPGIHFHTLPDLATIRGYIFAMDAGTPGAESMKAAKKVEFVDEPAGMCAAVVQVAGGVAIAHTVMRGPGTAQEGESRSINSVVQTVQEADLPPVDLEHAAWGGGDCQAAGSATKSYTESRTAHCMMTGHLFPNPRCPADGAG